MDFMFAGAAVRGDDSSIVRVDRCDIKGQREPATTLIAAPYGFTLLLGRVASVGEVRGVCQGVRVSGVGFLC